MRWLSPWSVSLTLSRPETDTAHRSRAPSVHVAALSLLLAPRPSLCETSRSSSPQLAALVASRSRALSWQTAAPQSSARLKGCGPRAATTT